MPDDRDENKEVQGEPSTRSVDIARQIRETEREIERTQVFLDWLDAAQESSRVYINQQMERLQARRSQLLHQRSLLGKESK